MAVRTDKRMEFLTDILTTAIENGGHGWFSVDVYRWDTEDGTALGAAHAVLMPHDEPNKRYLVNLDTLASGLCAIQDAEMRPVHGDPEVEVLHNSKTGQRLYMSETMRRNILLADRTNLDDGDLDCIDAMAVMECGLFGAVTYS